MASLSHASFATSNTQPVPSPKLLSSHLSMDPASSSPLSSLSQPQLSSPSANLSELNWLQKPNSKPPYNINNVMQSPFSHPFGVSSPFYDAYSEAGDSIEQSFTGGDEPLLTSSWEALDKLVSASMIGSASTTTEQLSDFASMHVSHAPATLQNTSPSSLLDMEHKPLSTLYGSYQKGNAWGGNQAASNVGLNLSSLISADPGFVERAAKFSSYSQQINSSTQAYNSSLLQINKNSYINPISKNDYNVDGACGVRKLIHDHNKNAAKNILQSASSNVAALIKQQYDVNNNTLAPNINSSPVQINTDKQSQASMASLSGSKKKREGSTKDGEVDDTAGNLGRKRAKAGEEDQDPSHHNKVNSKVNKSKASMTTGDKTKLQSGGSNSRESEQKSEVCNNSKTPSPSPSPSPPPKPDFIHVRARRGQATDSHSLAERVRREKISERMKYLQDLVPGCTKVTGKAVMLDEIINYVQSLQRQVEFLSMKLAAVHPSKLEFNFESIFGREVVQQPTLQNNGSASVLTPLLETHTPLPLSSSPFLQGNMQSLQPIPAYSESVNPSSVLHSFGPDPSLRRTLSMLAAASSDNFGECISQISDAWVDDDLQSIMPPLPGFSHSSLGMHPSLQGTMLNGQMKSEF